MASANEPGIIQVAVERAGKGLIPVFTFRSDSPINAGKSPDGVLANLTADKQIKVAKDPRTIRRGDIIRLMFKPDASDGIEFNLDYELSYLNASDCVIQIPYYENGGRRDLNAADFTFTTDLNALLAGGWVELGTGYTVPNNVDYAHLGGGEIVLSIEDDTA